VSLIERNDMVETFPARGSDQPFAERVCLRNAGWSFQHAKIHRPECVVHVGREDGITVVQHQAVRFIARHHTSELLCRPFGCWVFGEIPMEDPTRADLHHQEHKN
jgi:hypothetical protein